MSLLSPHLTHAVNKLSVTLSKTFLNHLTAITFPTCINFKLTKYLSKSMRFAKFNGFGRIISFHWPANLYPAMVLLDGSFF